MGRLNGVAAFWVEGMDLNKAQREKEVWRVNWGSREHLMAGRSSRGIAVDKVGRVGWKRMWRAPGQS